jgi:hypothetical protein
LNITIDFLTEEAAIGGDLYGNDGSVPNKLIIEESIGKLDNLMSRTLAILGDFHYLIAEIMALQAKGLFLLGKLEDAGKLAEKALELQLKNTK